MVWLSIPGGGAGSGWDAAVVSDLAGRPVKNEGGRADLPYSDSGRLCCHGDLRPQLQPQETEGGFPRREQQVQVWRVRRTGSSD